jgi:hypothetical protein
MLRTIVVFPKQLPMAAEEMVYPVSAERVVIRGFVSTQTIPSKTLYALPKDFQLKWMRIVIVHLLR